MAKATGEIIETPTEEMPYKARIMGDGELVQERFSLPALRARFTLLRLCAAWKRQLAKKGT